MHNVNDVNFNDNIKMTAVVTTEALILWIAMTLITLKTIVTIVWTKKETDDNFITMANFQETQQNITAWDTIYWTLCNKN